MRINTSLLNKRLSLCSLCLLLMCSQTLRSAQSPMLTLGYAEFPPYTFTYKSGDPDGILLNKAQGIISKAGYQFKPVSLPAKRLIKSLVRGDIDIFIGVKRESNVAVDVLEGKQVIGYINLNIYSTTKQVKVKLPDLLNKKVILIRGYTYGGALDYINDKKNNIETFITNTHESAFEMLAAKRADYLLAYQKPAELALQHTKVKSLHVTQLSSLPLHFIVSKNTPKAEEVLIQLERVFLKFNRK